MKKKEIKAVLESLKTIKMPKIEDKELRNALINDHFALFKEQKKLDDDLAALEDAHLGAFTAERQQIGELQQQLQAAEDEKRKKEIIDEINSHKELFDAVKGYNKAAEEILNGEVPVPFPIDKDAFIEAIQKQDYDLGLFESLFPLFNLN